MITLMLVTTVAVMPFKDLSGGKGQVGEAIRETVTSDLKDTGLKVVERGNIDKVIAEQNLQAKKNDLGMAESIRVGTLLGATMIVAGAYQKAASQVRVTARFGLARASVILGLIWAFWHLPLFTTSTITTTSKYKGNLPSPSYSLQ